MTAQTATHHKLIKARTKHKEKKTKKQKRHRICRNVGREERRQMRRQRAVRMRSSGASKAAISLTPSLLSAAYVDEC